MCSHIFWNVKFQPTWLKNTKYLLTEYPAGFFNCHLLFTWQSIKLYFSFTKKIWGCYSTSVEAITCKSIPQKTAQPSLQPCGEWMSWWRSFLLLCLLPFLCLHVMLLPEKQIKLSFSSFWSLIIVHASHLCPWRIVVSLLTTCWIIYLVRLTLLVIK